MKAGVWCWMLFLAGCGTSTGVFPYHVMNNDCSCELFHVTDEQARVTYSFSAVYSLDGAMKTRITVSIQNSNPDTLDLSLAYVSILSSNIPYRYNGKFLPITVSSVPPGTQRTLTLDGEVDHLRQSDPWLAIAGEKLVVTLKGMHIKGKPLSTQTIRFIPTNPKLSS